MKAKRPIQSMSVVASLALCIACGGGEIDNDGGVGDGDAGGTIDAPMSVVDSGPVADAENCQPPDMLFVLDRTMSMHRRPDGTVPADDPAGHMESKWYLAISAIEMVTQELQETVRFGLELFPVDRGGDVCVTLSQRISGITATNVQCEEGEVPVAPDIQTGNAIAGAIDHETTRLCRSTPIGAGLGTAIDALAAIQDPIRDQYAVLLTDGQDTCDEPLSLANAQALGGAGVGLYVIGFDGSGNGVDNGHLNDLACAGRTAPNFASACMEDGNGGYIAVERDGPALYLLASDANELSTQLEMVAGQVCCNCIE